MMWSSSVWKENAGLCSGDFRWLSRRTRRALEHVITAKRKSDHAPHLFLDIPLVSQLGYGHACEGRIDRLLRQSHELSRIVLVVLRQGDEKLGLDRLWLHWFSLCIQCASR
jgi:hypothetical protein